MMNKVSVIVIDSGIDTRISDLEKYIVKSIGYSINTNGYISENSDIVPNGTHGSAVALIIRDICKYVEFTSVNILNEKLTTDSRIMIFAMNEALKLQPDIIHMSIGTTNGKYKSYIKDIVNKSIGQKVKIVAAHNNDEIQSFPACIDGVIGVKSANYDILKTQFYKDEKYYYAPFSLKGIDGENEIENVEKLMGNSFAAAYITGHIANEIIRDRLSIENSK